MILDRLGRLNDKVEWVRETIRFLQTEDAEPVSEESGRGLSSDFLRILSSRSESAHISGLTLIGMTELLNTLASMQGNEILHGYGFYDGSQTVIAYLDEKQTSVVGAVIVGVKR